MKGRRLLMMSLICALGACATVAEGNLGEPLPRRAVLGAVLETPPDGGVAIREVFPGLSAEASGLQPGDRLLALDGEAAADVAHVLATLRGRRAGDVFDVTIERAGERRSVPLKLGEMPRAQYPGLAVDYGELDVDGTRRRTIVTRPVDADARLPAVLLIPGVGCSSIDVPVGPPRGYDLILNEMSRRGYLSMRLDKPGLGDSEGRMPCAEMDFEYENADYVAAIRALHDDPRVDPARIFLFGHSMGGVHAPLVAQRTAADAPVAGILAVATVATHWYAYQMENGRRQLPLYGTPLEGIEPELALYGKCTAAVAVQHLTVAQTLEAHPECDGMLRFPAHYSFWQQLVALDLGAEWRAVDAPVLAVYGTSDFLTSAAEHYYLAATVNRVRPGNASVEIVDGMDHYFQRVPSFDESRRAAAGEIEAEHDDRIFDILIDWLDAIGEREGRGS